MGDPPPEKNIVSINTRTFIKMSINNFCIYFQLTPLMFQFRVTMFCFSITPFGDMTLTVRITLNISVHLFKIL